MPIHPHSRPPIFMILFTLLIATVMDSACVIRQSRVPIGPTALPPGTTARPTRVFFTPSPTLGVTQTLTLRATLTTTPTITPTLAELKTGRVTVPILLYHHISDAGKTRYFVPVDTFKTQMKTLSEAGYQTVSVSQVADTLRGKAELPPKPIVLTFDDGYDDIYENALPVLEAYGFTGVVYIITGTLDSKLSYGYMQADALKALAAAGWEIGSHSISHSDLKASRLGMGTELVKSRQDLETLLGVPVRSFSYPYGIANAWIEDQVKLSGYDSAVGLDIMVTQTTKRLYYLSRREVHYSTSLADFRALIVPGEVELAAIQAETAEPDPIP